MTECHCLCEEALLRVSLKVGGRSIPEVGSGRPKIKNLWTAPLHSRSALAPAAATAIGPALLLLLAAAPTLHYDPSMCLCH